LVRTAYSNRNGGLYTYMDTSKEIRNVAVDNTNGLDTWPHYYVEQNFKQLIDLATLDTVTLKAKFRVWNVPSLNPVPGGAFANAVYGVGFTLRRKQNPYQVVFLGYHLYAKQANSPQTWGYDASFDADQFGQVFFNGDTLTDLGSLVPDDSNPIFSGGTFKEIELRQLFNKAKVAGANRPPFADPRQEMNRQDFLSTVFEDYYLAAVGVGWETMGWEEVRSQITEVSLQGQTLPFFDADVFQADYYSAQFDWAGQGRFGIQRTHWLQYGINDGWHGSATFWPDVYRTRYASEIAAVYGSATNRNAILHYIAIGRAQGKSGAP
jgi:hypothetical protein